MTLSVLATLARAHPPTRELPPPSSALPEHRADAVVAGPEGCLWSEADTTWVHSAGSGWTTRGRATATWRFDDRVWRLDGYELRAADRDSLDIRVAPQIFGTAIAADLRYPTTPNHVVAWPAPVATLPVRSFGAIDTVSVDLGGDGSASVVQTFSWQGWKWVEGLRTVQFSPEGAARSVHIETTDRWPDGCRVRALGVASVDATGLPARETWTFEGRCPLRRWSATWTFEFTSWRACTPGGPSTRESFGP